MDAIRLRIDQALFPAEPWAMAHCGGLSEGQDIGLSCDQCGACCRNLGIYIAQEDLDRESKLATVTTVDPDTPDDARYRFKLTVYEPCPMQDGNRCTIQDTKPDVCRATPPGSFCCQYSRWREKLPSLVPAGRH
jgi:hypothetical protein